MQRALPYPIKLTDDVNQRKQIIADSYTEGKESKRVSLPFLAWLTLLYFTGNCQYEAYVMTTAMATRTSQICRFKTMISARSAREFSS